MSSFLEKKSEITQNLKELEDEIKIIVRKKLEKIKNELTELRNFNENNFESLRIIIACIDSITNIENENDFNIRYIETLEDVVKDIEQCMSFGEIQKLLYILIKEGMKPVPDLKDLEPFDI